MMSKTNRLKALVLAATLGSSVAGGCLPEDASESPALGDGAVFADTDGSIVVYRRMTRDAIEFAALFRVDPVSEKQTFIGDISELDFGAEMFIVESGYAFHDEDDFLLYGRDGVRTAVGKASTFAESVRISGDRGYLLATVRESSAAPPIRVGVVDGSTMEVHELEATAGTIAGAAFAHQSDALYVGYYETATGKGHLLRWDIDAVKAGGYVIDPATGLFADPNLDVELGLTLSPEVEVVVSPNDKFVSVAGLGVVMPYTGRPALDVVDILSGAVREVDLASPGTTFTFDDAYLVYTDETGETLYSLELGDETSTLKATGVGTESYAVSKTSNHIVETWDSTVGPIPLVGVVRQPIAGDFILGRYLFLPGAKMYSVATPLGGDSVLQNLDLTTGKVTTPFVGDFSSGMTLLPSGSVVLSDTTAKTLTIVDPATDTVTKTLPIPTLL